MNNKLKTMIFLQYEHTFIQFVDSDDHFEWSLSWSFAPFAGLLVVIICSVVGFVRHKRGRQGIFCITLKRLRNIEYENIVLQVVIAIVPSLWFLSHCCPLLSEVHYWKWFYSRWDSSESKGRSWCTKYILLFKPKASIIQCSNSTVRISKRESAICGIRICAPRCILKRWSSVLRRSSIKSKHSPSVKSRNVKQNMSLTFENGHEMLSIAKP